MTLHISEHPVSGWQVTEPDGQHAAHIAGSYEDAFEAARRLDHDAVVVDDEL